MEKNSQEGSQKKKGKLYIPLIIVVVAVLAGGIYWYIQYSKYISTDDAYVDADRAVLSSKVIGRISKLYVQEGDSISKGMLLAELDSSELVAQKNQNLALRNEDIANERQLEAKYLSDQEGVRFFEIKFRQAKDDLSRAKTQHDGGVMTQEKFEHAQNDFETAKANLETAQKNLAASKALITKAQATVEKENALINLTITQMKNMRLYAPFDGVVSKRYLLPGEIAQPGQSIVALTNNRNLWVVIYIEETKLSEMYINQKVNFTVDAFPGIDFTGKIFLIGSNTASQFSLIPPSNASGNFTKITQRVPVKISIDGMGNNHKANVKLISGMSAVVSIIKK
jgi:membrane fusion protein, multidrug efflux system